MSSSQREGDLKAHPTSRKQLQVGWNRFVVRPVRRRTKSPFSGPSSPIVHVADHRVGTVWFGRVLSAVAHAHGLTFRRVGGEDQSPTTTDIRLFLTPRAFDRTQLAAFRGSHIVRDPRDIVVSGYHYHLWTPEPWARLPDQRFGGLSYQEHLQTLDPEHGLEAEIHRCAEVRFPSMAAWEAGRPEFLELRYEDVVADEATSFAQVFRHYGFHEKAVSRSVEIALGFSFGRLTGRQLGDVQAGNHLRSGQPGQWREFFTEAHKDLFRELNGPLLQRLGYETDDAW